MKFVDDLFKMYAKDIHSDEDALLLVSDIVENTERKELEKYMKDMSDDEVMEMVMLYMYERLRLLLHENRYKESSTDETHRIFH
ncbi:DUF6154 family protein [Alkalihalobacillus sp. LMS39]|uniref:DUF6154 family protein n=1 Tax=Alkalihalobacillus sp. LMS39 TaxID=2924032 RepID=UPI001FB2C091|nr:DUF6154 family protein [Alkalihalobacillus sp. LMS39]UOE93213.1 DUF6154 family protein [Alkalihalobacillus sp. LMS39]